MVSKFGGMMKANFIVKMVLLYYIPHASNIGCVTAKYIVWMVPLWSIVTICNIGI